MLLPGCSCCGTCEECTRECTEPHTGDAFEVVYTRPVSFSGDENLTDGYLTASGDYPAGSSPTGMPGSAPWVQQVGGVFILGGSSPGTRFPCSVRVSFWRTTNVLAGPGGGGTPSTALTENTITVNVSSGAVVFPDGRVVTPADGPVALTTVPLRSSSADPRTGEGSVSVAAQCDNVETIFSIQATIRWTVSNRQHRLFGIVRECYEEGNPCEAGCSGSGVPDVLYLTISNWTGPTPDGTSPNGTYVLDRIPNNCYWYTGRAPGECDGASAQVGWLNAYPNEISLRTDRVFSGVCYGVGLDVVTAVPWDFCLNGVIATGTNGTAKIAAWSVGSSVPSYMSGSPFTNCFDWKLET